MTLIFFLGGGEEVRWKTVRTYGKILATPLNEWMNEWMWILVMHCSTFSWLITKFSKKCGAISRVAWFCMQPLKADLQLIPVKVCPYLMAELFFCTNRFLAALSFTEHCNSFIDGDWQLYGCPSQNQHWPTRWNSFTLCLKKLYIFQSPWTLKNCRRDSGWLCKLNMRSFNLQLINWN